MTAEPQDETTFSWPAAMGRLAIGLAQGLALYGLLQARQHHGWPATERPLFAALLLVTLMVPALPLAALGRTRPLTLAIWTLAGAAVVAAFGVFDRLNALTPPAGEWQDPEPEMIVFLGSAAFLFIGHHLVTAADDARRWLAPYSEYFDDASMNAVRVVLSIAFVGVLWLALMIGAALFSLIGIRAFERVIEKEWFVFPVSTLAFAAAVQLTDVRAGLIRGVRTVALILLAWLLPVATLIAGAFLIALPFTGLEPLFATRSATAILLAAAAGLIILINAAYQDGQGRTPRILKAVVMAAAVAVAPLVGIAAYALALRIGQHGFTPERVWALACVIVGAGFAIGYLAAIILSRSGWMKLLERTNVLMGFVTLVVLIALFTPIANPARLSVDSQLARLASGRVSPDQFDYRFLQSGAGRRGEAALEQLRRASATPRDREIAAAAERGVREPEAPRPADVASRITVYPRGHALPEGFANLAASAEPPGCMRSQTARCEAYLLDADGDGQQDVLLANIWRQDGLPSAPFQFYRRELGQWQLYGHVEFCGSPDVEALRSGRFSLQTVQARELVMGNQRFPVQVRECPPRMIGGAPPPVAMPPAPE